MIYYHYSGEVGAIPFPTFAEAVASAELELKEYRDVACDGWSEEAGYISVYKSREPTDRPQETALLVAQSTETILEERPDDVDEDGWSEELQDYWDYDFDYLAEYNIRVVDPIARAEGQLARVKEGLEEERFKAQTPRIGDENSAATIRIWEGYVRERGKYLDQTKRLVADIGVEVDV